jgi:hypothetical protein
MVKLVFHLNNELCLNCDSSKLIGVFNNPLIELVEVVTNNYQLPIKLKDNRFISYEKEGKQYVGRQRTIQGVNFKEIYEVGRDGLVAVKI